MADNELVKIVTGDIGHEQLAPNKAGRTSFTPGKATSSPNELAFPEDFRIPTGNPVFDEAEVGSSQREYTRIHKMGRSVIGDQVIPAPVEIRTRVETVDYRGGSGTHVAVDTVTPKNPKDLEKNVGGDNIVEDV